MLLLAAAALATVPAPRAAPSTIVQATATIRVLTAVRLTFDGSPNPGVPAARDAVVRLGDGTAHAAKLIEFQ
jgi:hypothetical protein